MIRSILILAPLLALFLFPAAFFMVLVVAASVAFPPAGILYGILADLVYFAPGAASVPHGLIYGTAASISGLLISRFFETRIVGFSTNAI